MWDILSEYSYEQFKLKLFNDILSKQYDVTLKDNLIIINKDNYEISISLEEAYDTYTLCEDYNLVCDMFFSNIENYLKKHKFHLNTNKIYPVIRKADFGKNEPFPFVREYFNCDLEILYVQDMGEMFRYISKTDIENLNDLRESAFKNLNMLANGLIKIEKGVELYANRIINDFSSSYFLSEHIQRQIKRYIGSKYLLAIPSTTYFFVAADYPGYYNLLENLIRIDNGPNKISSNIYRVVNNTWEMINNPLTLINNK